MMERFSLADRVAIVTGAASGIGEAIARGLTEAGAFIVCLDRSDEANREVASSLGDRAVARTGDVTNQESVDGAVAGAVELWGRIDVLVNSAGIGGRGAALEYDPGLWQSVLETNLTGSFLMCQAAARRMVSQGTGGTIVNIASIGAMVGFPGSVGYQASKGGVVQMTRTLAVEWAPNRIRVNAIAPGHVATGIVRKQWQTEPQLREFFLARTPLGRLGEPEDIVGAAIFLASDASAMVTGQMLVVDGGYTVQ